jgi:hypothetical protein
MILNYENRLKLMLAYKDMIRLSYRYYKRYNFELIVTDKKIG